MDHILHLVLPFVDGRGSVAFAQTCRKMHDFVFKQHKWERLNIVIRRQKDLEGLVQFMRMASLDAVWRVRLIIHDSLKSYKMGLGPVVLRGVVSLKLRFHPGVEDYAERLHTFDLSPLLSDCYLFFPNVKWLEIDSSDDVAFPDTDFRPLGFDERRSLTSGWDLTGLGFCVLAADETEALVRSIQGRTTNLRTLSVSEENCDGPAMKSWKHGAQVWFWSFAVGRTCAVIA